MNNARVVTTFTGVQAMAPLADAIHHTKWSKNVLDKVVKTSMS